jgi:hypothetical protein
VGEKLLAPWVWSFSFIFGHQLKLGGGDDSDVGEMMLELFKDVFQQRRMPERL